MTDYDALVKALRYCGDEKNKDCSGCAYAVKCGNCFMSPVVLDAADAIEEQQAELQRVVEAEINECNRRIATAQVNAKLAKNYWSPPKEETE